jgi:hypothetical protein
MQRKPLEVKSGVRPPSFLFFSFALKTMYVRTYIVHGWYVCMAFFMIGFLHAATSLRGARRVTSTTYHSSPIALPFRPPSSHMR